MWTRRELKERARYALRQNYWRIILVSLLMSLFAGGIVGSSSGSSTTTKKETVEELDGVFIEDETSDVEQVEEHMGKLARLVDENPFFVLSLVLVLMILFLVVFIVAMLLQAFLINPFKVGAKRFFSHSIVQRAEVKEAAYAYDHSYKNVVKTMFLRDMYIFLWTLLFLIPGFVKRYEYQLVPYLLGEHPEMSSEEAFSISKKLMHGNKWKAFVLDLSFFGWMILSAMTAGLLAVFYVMPYRYLTEAALYRELIGYDREQPVMYQAQAEEVSGGYAEE